MEDLLYWIIEYIKVLLGYGFIMFLWPSVVFRKYLKGKSVTFRFGFCTTVQVVLISTVVLMLGLLHILNRWTMCIVFYGVFSWSLRDKLKPTKEIRKKFKNLVTGTLGWKHCLLLCKQWLARNARQVWSKFWTFYKAHWLEYTLLVVTVVYGMIYFSWGVFQDHSYGFSDVYVHNSWIYQLKQGNAFSAGIYPEGMHCLVYSLEALFGVRIYSTLLFGASFNVMLVLIAAYCLMKELFKWRYSPIFALNIFLTLDVVGRYIMIGMARMQCSLPQEFGFPAAIICTLYLIRYLRSKNYFVYKEKKSKGCWDENLLLFIMALAATIVIHFYATIMAFFLCVGVAVCCVTKIFTRERFLPLVTAVILGVLIAAAPMAIGYATGIPLQGSLNWAMGIIQGSSTDTEVPEENSEENSEDNFIEDTIETEEQESVQLPENTGSDILEQPDSSFVDVEDETKKVSFVDSVLQRLEGIWEKIKAYGSIVYEKGYLFLYGDAWASIFVKLSIVTILFWIGYRLIHWLIKIVIHKEFGDKTCFDGYPIIVISSVMYMLYFAPHEFGLPKLIEGSRIGFITHLLIVMIMTIPFDVLFTAVNKLGIKKILHVLSLMTSIGIVMLIYNTGNYHSYLYFELTRFNSTVNVANDIIDELPQDSYTIVSPTEELYQVIEFGRHEELLTFMQNQYREHYTIPTEYIFIFVEKKPFRYAQYHFFDGPNWLAQNEYQKIYGTHSMYPEYLTSEISNEAAEKGLMYFSKLSDSYANLTSRVILQSKAYKWCEKFDELYPYELKTYYEDEYLVCYYFKQNTKFLYNLALDKND